MRRMMLRTVRRSISGGQRFLVPVFGIVLAHIVIGLALYYSLIFGVALGAPVMPANSFGWASMSSAWDSNYYRAIAINWYPSSLDPLWAFFPLYPMTVRTLSFLGLEVRFTAVVVAITCGLGSVIVFQTITEQYMVRTQALIATCLYFLFPPVFVFSFVAYAEPMYLLLALLAWHFHRKQAEAKASIAAGLCALSRPEAFLIVIPLLYDYLSNRQFKHVPYVLVPFSAVGAWELYGLAKTGVWLPSYTADTFWNTPHAQAVRLAIQRLASGNLSSLEILFPYRWLIAATMAAVAIVLLLAWRNWKIDRALCVYLSGSTIILASTLSVAYRSFPRILSFIFPAGLPLHTRKLNLLVVTIILFLLLDYIAWLAFLTDGFY